MTSKHLETVKKKNNNKSYFTEHDSSRSRWGRNSELRLSKHNFVIAETSFQENFREVKSVLRDRSAVYWPGCDDKMRKFGGHLLNLPNTSQWFFGCTFISGPTFRESVSDGVSWSNGVRWSSNMIGTTFCSLLTRGDMIQLTLVGFNSVLV